MKTNETASKGFYIPWIFVVIYPIALLLLMLLPNNQYLLMNEYGYIEQTQGSLALAMINMLTVCQIVGLTIVSVLGILGLLTTKLFNGRVETIVTTVIAFFALSFHTLFFIFALIAQNEGTQILAASNILVFVLHVLFFLTYVLLTVKFVYHPYHVLMEEDLEKRPSSNRPFPASEEEQRRIYRTEMAYFDKEKMLRYLKEKYDAGEITKEQYEGFLSDLDK